MSNFLRFDGKESAQDFPADAVGFSEWQRLLERLGQVTRPDADDFAGSLEDPLAELRQLHQNTQLSARSRYPRVFISHRKCDKDPALRCAWLANNDKFEYWVDVLDPMLIAANHAKTFNAYQKALLIAGAIEIGLLNCTHILALLTKNAQGSAWIPYEYGRVKDSNLLSMQAAGWFEPQLAQSPPEYFNLGLQLTGKQVAPWFRHQLSQWKTAHPGQPARATMRWPIPGLPPPALPDE